MIHRINNREVAGDTLRRILLARRGRHEHARCVYATVSITTFSKGICYALRYDST